VLADPRIDILGLPHLAHAQLMLGPREIGTVHDLLDALAPNAESLTDLGRSRQVTSPIPLPEAIRRSMRWWQRDTTTAAHLHSESNCVNHKQYWLTCEKYDDLLRRSDFACEICAKPHQNNGIYKKPHIDHDHDLGRWAVRGLLCHSCNTSLDYPSMAECRSAYLANSWYVKELARESMTPGTIPPEPRIGTVAADVADRWRVRQSDGWYSDGGNRWWNRNEPWTWTDWITEVGPHNVRAVLVIEHSERGR
jgi:recombination endonuclease VII